MGLGVHGPIAVDQTHCHATANSPFSASSSASFSVAPSAWWGTGVAQRWSCAEQTNSRAWAWSSILMVASSGRSSPADLATAVVWRAKADRSCRLGKTIVSGLISMFRVSV